MAKALVWEREVGFVSGLAVNKWADLASRLNITTYPVSANDAVNFSSGQVAFEADIPDENIDFFKQEMNSYPFDVGFEYVITDFPVVVEPAPTVPTPIQPGEPDQNANGDTTYDSGGTDSGGETTTTGDTTTTTEEPQTTTSISYGGGLKTAVVVGLVAVGVGLAFWFGRRRED